jgi:hypothetical protein
MTGSPEPKKETVRIRVSPPGKADSPSQSAGTKTVRMHLPTRQPSDLPPALDSLSPVSAATAVFPGPSIAQVPKKDLANWMSAAPPTNCAVEMKKTQPLNDPPAVDTPATAGKVAPQVRPTSISRIDEIPMALCWALLGASAAILILQIWNYVS